MRRAVRSPIGKASRLAALAATALLLPAAPLGAQDPPPPTDYDTDDDGLIEVANLAQLNAIRYDMDGNGIPRGEYQGTTIYAAAFPNASTDAAVRMGCPTQTLSGNEVSVCSGYELTADLDFDTDGDGDVDSDDDYWNSGAGWLPLSNFPSGNVFTATFEGNGHVIDNLFMNITISNSSRRPAGLFNSTGSDAVIRNLGLTNVDMTAAPSSIGTINAFMYAGALVGQNSGTVSGVFVTGKVTAENIGRVGGMVGSHGSKIRNSYAMVRVKGGANTGGLAGNGVPIASYATGTVMGKDTPANQNENLGGLLGSGGATASYATGRVWTPGTIRSGGLVGQGCTGRGGLPDCADSYWDSVTSGLETSTPHGVPRTTAELQEPTGYSGIYADWNVDVDGDMTNDDPWDFGTSTQYPALKVDMSDADTTATWQEFGWQLRAGPVLTMTQDPVTQVNLSWTAVDVSHWNPAPTVTYTVYRLDGTTLEILSEDITTLSYADTDITTGDTYSYQVVAEVEGGEAARSEVLEWTVGVAGQPYPAARLRDLALVLGGGWATLDLAAAFTDPNDDPLTYEVDMSAADLLFPLVQGTSLRLFGLGPGRVTVTVTATDPGDLSASQVFDVTLRAGVRDHDLDDDNLIEVATLAQLDAMRHDLDGDGVPAAASWRPYYAAFTEGALDMGCPDACAGYELTAPLDFDTNGNGDADAGDAFWNEGAGWAPIGSDADPFAATFEGGGHVVSNLFIDRSTQDGVGLFGHVGAGGNIRRLGVADVSVTGNNGVGGLVGRNRGFVEWCFATGAVTGNDDVGGVAGHFSAGRLRPCYAAGTVSGNDAVGGLVGHATAYSSFIGSYAASRVSGNDAVGGLVGRAADNTEFPGSFARLYLTYATGRVQGRQAVGGLVGRLEFGSIYYSYATGYVAGQSGVGPLVGEVAGGAIVVSSYWDTDTSGHATALYGIGQTTRGLQRPTSAAGIYAGWNPYYSGHEYDNLWDFGTSAQYPVLQWSYLNMDWREVGYQLRTGPELTANPRDAGGAARVALSWSGVDTTYWSPPPDLGYTLTRSDGATMEVLAEATSEVEYVDADLPGSGTYAYQVAAGVNGGEAARSAVVDMFLVVTRPPPPPPPRPTGPDVTVSFAPGTYEAEEGASAAAVTVQLSAAPERAVTIPLTATPGGGATAADYRVVPDSVTFGEDSTAAVLTVAALADAEIDVGESVVLGFGGLPAGVSAGDQATVEVLLVDTTTVMVSFERPAYVAAEGGAGAGVTVRFSVAPARPVTVPLTATPGGGATAADYAGVPASVTFGPTDTMRAFTVTAPADDDDDDGESVSIAFGTLPAPVIADSPTRATVALADAGGPRFEADLDAGLPVRAVHLVELRLRVDALRRAHGLAAFAWTDAVVEPGATPVRAVHPTELRTALDEVHDAAGRARPRYADASVRAGATPIRAAHFLELRSAIVTLESSGG